MINNLEELRNFLKILSKKHSMEILIYCSIKPRTTYEISNYLKAPYTTVKTRLDELISIHAVSFYNDTNKRGQTQSFTTENFQFTINPKRISQLTN